MAQKSKQNKTSTTQSTPRNPRPTPKPYNAAIRVTAELELNSYQDFISDKSFDIRLRQHFKQRGKIMRHRMNAACKEAFPKWLEYAECSNCGPKNCISTYFWIRNHCAKKYTRQWIFRRWVDWYGNKVPGRCRKDSKPRKPEKRPTPKNECFEQIKSRDPEFAKVINELSIGATTFALHAQGFANTSPDLRYPLMIELRNDLAQTLTKGRLKTLHDHWNRDDRRKLRQSSHANRQA